MIRVEGDGPPPGVTDIADQLMSIVSNMAQAAAVAAARVPNAQGDTKDARTYGLYVASVAGAALVHIVASMIGFHGDKNRTEIEPDDVPKLINPESTLLAALMLQAMAPEVTFEGTTPDGVKVGSEFAFGPPVFLEAMQKAERLVGPRLDGQVHPSFLRLARECAAKASDPLQKFMSTRSSGNLH